MLTFFSDTKIYVHCPSGRVTGGAELLHQFVSLLRDLGRDAYVVYFGSSHHEIPKDYCSYNIAVSDEIIDSSHNIEVFYEGIFGMLKTPRNTQVFLWWISVDNFFMCAKSYLCLKDLFMWSPKLCLIALLQRIKMLFKGENRFVNNLSIKEMVDMGCPCGYQAEYIQHFLQKCGFKELMALKDYINTDHIVPYDISGRENIVLYNPSKGFEYTKRLIAYAPDINWFPLQGLSREELVCIVRKAKVYIDFGYHPGKDRLPRECAMNGCCVITGMRGSAAFFEDVPIPCQYKFNEKSVEISEIVNQIRWSLDNYETAINDFQFYRNAISFETKEFEQQVKSIFLS